MADKTYVAVVSFTIGSLDRKIEAGETMTFDGQAAILSDGQRVALPRLTSIIKAGWLKDANSNAPSTYRQPSANIAVSPSKPNSQNKSKSMPISTSVDEQIVGTVDVKGREAMRQAAKERIDPQPVREHRTITRQDEGHVVKSLGKPKKTTLITAENVSTITQEIRNLDNKDGREVPSKIMAEGITFQQENVSLKASGGHTDFDGSNAVASGEDGVMVGRVHKNAAKIEPDMKRRGRKPTIDENRVAAAKKMCTDFPSDWNFLAHSQDKLNAAKQFKSRPDILQAIYKSETNSFRRILKSKFPESAS